MQDAERFYETGVSLANAGCFEQAVDKFLEAIQTNPTDPYYHVDLGMAYLRLGRLNEAIRSCECAVNLDSNHIKAKTFLSKLTQLREELNFVDLATEIRTIQDIVERPLGFAGLSGVKGYLLKDFGPITIFSSTSPDATSVRMVSGYPIALPINSELVYHSLKTDKGWLVTANAEPPTENPSLMIFTTIPDASVDNTIPFIRHLAKLPILEVKFVKMLFWGSDTNHKVFETGIGMVDSVTKKEKGGTRGNIRFRNENRTIHYFLHMPSMKLEIFKNDPDQMAAEKPRKPWYKFWA